MKPSINLNWIEISRRIFFSPSTNKILFQKGAIPSSMTESTLNCQILLQKLRLQRSQWNFKISWPNYVINHISQLLRNYSDGKFWVIALQISCQIHPFAFIFLLWTHQFQFPSTLLKFCQLFQHLSNLNRLWIATTIRKPNQPSQI